MRYDDHAAAGDAAGTTFEVPLLSASEAAAGDEAAVDAGDTWAALMERAAGHLARGIVAAAGRSYGLRVAFLTGKGNNGGDGWAAARRVQSLGAQPWVVAVQGLDADMSEEAADNRRRYLDSGGRASGLDELDRVSSWCDVAVDCMLGTGATGAPRGDIGVAVATLVGRRPPVVVACDLPTGVNGDDGSVPGDAVEADLTVTFGARKRGLLLHPGAGYAGRVVVGDLGPRYRPPRSSWSALTAAGARPPVLAEDADKRARGVVLVVAGSAGMVGAAILTARGALAAGAGLVTLAVPRSLQQVAAGAVPPALTAGLPEQDGAVSPGAVEEILEHASSSDVVAVGPGMTPGEGTRAVVDALLGADVAVVVDADGVNAYRGEGDALARHAGPLVLTPHHRELARIADLDDGDEAWQRRVEVVPELSARLDATIVGKGPGTIVAAPGGSVRVTPTGSPALGAGGSGDVLTGMLAAGIASADDVALAVARTCWWHGLAGQIAGVSSADRASSAHLVEVVPRALELTASIADDAPGWPFAVEETAARLAAGEAAR